MEYGIACNNKFGFLSDEEAEDPQILLKKAIQKKELMEKEEKKIATEKAAVAAAELAAAEQKRAAHKEGRRENAEGARGAGRGRGGARRPRDDTKPRGEEGTRPTRGGRGGANRPRREREVKESEESAAFSGEEARPSEETESRRGARGGARGIPRRGGARVRLDRHSGSEQTGVKSVDKKDGHGKGNWGTEQDELAAEDEVNVSSEVEREKTEEELKREAELERAARELTLSEFKAAQKVDRPEFNIRKAGEGVDAKNMPNLVPLARETDEKVVTEEVIVVHREPKRKTLVIDFKFKSDRREDRRDRDDRRDREDRRDRGDRPARGGSDRPSPRGGRGGRGGRGAGGRGGSRNVENSPAKEDTSFDFSSEAFPGLAELKK
uniref:HABP4_PAI-RBP1 domain-containing protein n=1 Tax=Steinernema glaseri TaxID=37863 RepID=A0A1I8A6V4_9BILA